MRNKFDKLNNYPYGHKEFDMKLMFQIGNSYLFNVDGEYYNSYKACVSFCHNKEVYVFLIPCPKWNTDVKSTYENTRCSTAWIPKERGQTIYDIFV